MVDAFYCGLLVMAVLLILDKLSERKSDKEGK